MPDMSHGLSAAEQRYKPAKPPRNFAVKRHTAMSCDLVWKGDYTDAQGDYPWLRVYIERMEYSNGQWVQLAELMWDATSYTDNALKLDHSYQYRARAKGPGGWSEYVYTETIYTTPYPPNSVTITRTSADTVSVDADTSDLVTATHYEVRTRLNGVSGDWVSHGWHSSLPVTVQVGAGSVQAVVFAANQFGSSVGLRSKTISAMCAPLAPGVSCRTLITSGSDINVEWSPNHPDGSLQTAAQLEYTEPGQRPRTIDYTSETRETIPSPGDGVHAIRVRTKGVHSSWGEWSYLEHVTVAPAPGVVITNPPTDGFAVQSMPLHITFEATHPDGIAYTEVELKYRGGKTILRTRITNGATSMDFNGTYVPNDTELELSVLAHSAVGLEKRAVRYFRTGYAEPQPVRITVEEGKGLSTLVNVSFPEPEPDVPPIERASLVRINKDGSNTLLTSEITGSTQIKDKLPPLNSEFKYRVVAVSNVGTVGYSEISYTVDSGGMEAYNFGANAERVYILGFDANCRTSFKHSGEEFRFATGRDTPHLPTFYPDGDVDVSGSRSYVVTSPGEYCALRAEALRRDSATCWYRDAWGNRAFCRVGIGLDYDAKDYLLFGVDMDIDECVWEEPVNG